MTEHKTWTISREFWRESWLLWIRNRKTPISITTVRTNAENGSKARFLSMDSTSADIGLQDHKKRFLFQDRFYNREITR